MKKTFFALLALATPFVVFSQTLPIIRTNPILWVTEEEAATSVQMIFRGSDATTEVWMEYGIVGVGFNEETDNEYLEAPSSMGFLFEDLNPETDYMYRAVAETYDGVVYGDTVFFTTLSENPVEIVTDYAAPFAVVMAGDPPFTATWVFGNILDLGEYDELAGVVHYGKNPTDLNLSASPYGIIEDEGLVQVFLPDLEWGQVYSYEFCVYVDTGLLCGEVENFDTPLKYNPTTNYDLENFEVYQGGTCSQYIEFELEDVEEPVNISVEVKSADGNVVFTDELTMSDDEDVEWIVDMSEFVDDFNIDTTFSFTISFDDGLTNKKLKGLFDFNGFNCKEEFILDSYIAVTDYGDCGKKVEYFTTGNETDDAEINIRKTGGPILMSDSYDEDIAYGVLYFDALDYEYEGETDFKATLSTESYYTDQSLNDALLFTTNCEGYEGLDLFVEGDLCWITMTLGTEACYDSIQFQMKKVVGPVVFEYTTYPTCFANFDFEVFVAPYGSGTYKATVRAYDDGVQVGHLFDSYEYTTPDACGKSAEPDNNSEMQIYPNPATSYVYINAMTEGMISVKNSIGEVVLTKYAIEGVNKVDFDLVPGVYVLVLGNDAKQFIISK